ncbi:MAG: FtsX-like permease family protein [Fluviicola sp.]
MVHWITNVSVIGIAAITTALIILVGAFNGIESMVERLYSDFDPDIIVRSEKGKTFSEELIKKDALLTVPGVFRVHRAVEETVYLKHQKKGTNARMLGVDSLFLTDCNMSKHLVEGSAAFSINGRPAAIAGAGVLNAVDGYISTLDGTEEIQLYSPLRDASISRRKSPFKVLPLAVVGSMNFNREVNNEYILLPLELAREQLNYDKDLTALFISLKPGFNPQRVQQAIKDKLGNGFSVKTAAEKNELIFKTSQSEKKIVIVILVFVFILAAFNLIASLTMLYIEKSDNIETFYRIGAKRSFVFSIFFTEGMLIAMKGIVYGVILGVGVCLAQWQWAVLEMPNSGGEAFPIAFTWNDGFLIAGLVLGLSAIMSFAPVYYMVYKRGK